MVVKIIHFAEEHNYRTLLITVPLFVLMFRIIGFSLVTFAYALALAIVLEVAVGFWKPAWLYTKKDKPGDGF